MAPVPIRKQPPRNIRNQGCQTCSDLENKGCQTTLEFESKKIENPTEKFLQLKRVSAIEKEVRYSAELEFNKILNEEKRQHQIEVKKLKKKIWCAMCLKAGKRFDSI